MTSRNIARGAGKGLQNKLGNSAPSTVRQEAIVGFFNWLFSDGINLLKEVVDSGTLTESERQQVKSLLEEHNIEVRIDDYTQESTLIEAISKDIQDYLNNPEIDFHAKESLVAGLDSILDGAVERSNFIGEG